MVLQLACHQPERIRILESSSNNSGLDEQDRTVEKYEIVRFASIFGGTSTYWGMLWGNQAAKWTRPETASRNLSDQGGLELTRRGLSHHNPLSENPRYVVTVLPSLRIAWDKSKDKTKPPLFQITKSLPEAYRAGEIQPIRYENTVITLLTVPMFCPKI